MKTTMKDQATVPAYTWNKKECRFCIIKVLQIVLAGDGLLGFQAEITCCHY